MKIDAVQRRGPGQLDVAFFGQFASERFEQSLAGLYPAAGQVPAIGIGVLDQEHAAVAVEHYCADTQRQPAREPPVEMHQAVDHSHLFRITLMRSFRPARYEPLSL